MMAGTLSEVSLQRTEPLQSATPTAGETMIIAARPKPACRRRPRVKPSARSIRGRSSSVKKQGEQFAATGDLVTARIVLQRAAEAGDAEAAMALGATYDPEVLSKLGAVGISADVEKARSWYQKAESFGSSEATRRLAVLANR